MGKLLSTFGILSLGYFVYVFLAFSIIAVLLIVFKNVKKKEIKKLLSIALIVGAGVFLALEYLGRITCIEKFNIFYNLPIELVHILTYITIIAFVSKSAAWSRYLYFVVVPMAIYSLIFIPDFYFTFNAFSFPVLGYVFTMICIISYSLLNLFWSDVYIDKRDIFNVNITNLMILAGLHLVNVFLRFSGWAINSNYLGTMGENYDIIVKTIYSIIPVPFVSILPLYVLLIGIQILMVLPFDIKRKKRKKQNEMDEIIALGNVKVQQELLEQQGPVKSQIIIKSEQKAEPEEEKDVMDNQNESFVNTNKQIKINNSVDDEKVE